jgi:hypothetical protein
MNCEWVESVPGIAIDESKRSFPGINHLRLFSNLWFVELVVEHRRGITPTDRVPESIQGDAAAFASDLENDLGFIHG